MRLRTDSAATAASKRGPKALAATSAGSIARVCSPQPGQRTRGQRCSINCVEITGSSSIWWRTGCPTARSSLAAKTWPHSQRSGQCSITSSTAESGNSSRPWPSWPGWAPCESPERSLPRAGGAACPADQSLAAARSCASSWPARAPASPPASRADGCGDPSPAALRPPSRVQRRRSPPPLRAPHAGIRRSWVMSPRGLNGYIMRAEGLEPPRAFVHRLLSTPACAVECPKSCSADEGLKRRPDFESAQRPEPHRPYAVRLLVERVPHASVAQRTDMPVGALVSARADEARVETVASVVEGPDSHAVWHRPSCRGQARAIIAHDPDIDRPGLSA